MFLWNIWTFTNQIISNISNLLTAWNCQSARFLLVQNKILIEAGNYGQRSHTACYYSLLHMPLPLPTARLWANACHSQSYFPEETTVNMMWLTSKLFHSLVKAQLMHGLCVLFMFSHLISISPTYSHQQALAPRSYGTTLKSAWTECSIKA